MTESRIGLQPAPLQQSVTNITEKDTFTFACHKGVECFTECCRMLELAVTPYDVLRLKAAMGLSSDEFINTYIIIEREPGETFPRFYLTMVDDGRASCVFVTKDGCSVYDNRPAACRAYPVGRAAMRGAQGQITEHFVLIKEPHCHGFRESVEQSVTAYSKDQDLNTYNRFNDALIDILQHEAVRKGFIPSKKQIELFILALYNLDQFRHRLFNNTLTSTPLNTTQKERLKDDENLLLYSINWVTEQLFILP